MKRATFLVFAIVLLVSVAYADDVWKSKPYQQWDLKDVQKILADSPWAHVVHITASWRKPGDATLPLEPGGSTPGNYGTQSGSTAGGSGAGAQVPPPRPAPAACPEDLPTPTQALSRKINPS